jgi:predicted aminopeptidase
VRRRGTLRVATGLLTVVSLLAGCGTTAYLGRAGWSEARVLLRREPIDELLARPDLEPALRQRFELVLAVRRFAADTLGLRVGDSYGSFARVDDEAVVHVLSAAHRDRLEAYTWWYPLVGRLPYRGFFARDAAERAARRLEAEDLDVEVRPAVAFSTLGWFADPLLSSVAARPPVTVADTVLHELFHATLYLPGAARFNESAATFAGARGAIAFFCASPDADAAQCEIARRRWAETLLEARVLTHLAARLNRLYAAGPSPAARDQGRAWYTRAAAAELARRGLDLERELLPPNNARLLGSLLYLTDLDAFDALAPSDADLGPALGALVASAREAADPFAAVHQLAARRMAKLQKTPAAIE